MVLAAPSRDGVAAARDTVRSLLGWEDVQRQLAEHTVDPLQGERLRKRLEEARRRVPDTVRAAWCIVVTLNEAGAPQAFRLPADGGPLFAQIKGDERSRIKETAVDAEAFLPDGPYDLWRESKAIMSRTSPTSCPSFSRRAPATSSNSGSRWS